MARVRQTNGPQALGRSRSGWSTKLHLVAAHERNVLTWSLTPGQHGDAPEGRRLIEALGASGYQPVGVPLLMDAAYGDNATRRLAREQGLVPAVPPTATRRLPWAYDRTLYRMRNRFERLFRRLKEWRSVFTRYDKLDAMSAAFITVALIAEAVR